MDKFLENQIALVTGGAQGIGWGIAQALADNGAELFVCDISEINIAQAKEELAGSPWEGQMHFALGDVSDREAVEGWITAVYQQNGHIDILICNAVYVRWELAQNLPIDDIEKMMQVGYFGVVHTIQAVLPLMQQAGRGDLVIIGSSAGKLYVTPSMAGYSAMKAAVEAFTRVLQLELAQSPIHVLLVRPAAVAGTQFFGEQVSSKMMPRWADIVPFITPPHVAWAVIRGLRRRRDIVNVPGYLGSLFLLFAAAPKFLIWFMGLGGNGSLDYGKVSWRYHSRK
jgi:NAD(P)-dependent dehydrogenase (short-subunit alcohol dehydrogenase family)